MYSAKIFCHSHVKKLVIIFSYGQTKSKDIDKQRLARDQKQCLKCRMPERASLSGQM